MTDYLEYEDDSEAYFRDVFENHGKEARKRVSDLLAEDQYVVDANGCFVTPTDTPRKVVFHNRQLEIYRFIYCVLNLEAASRDRVVRHRCSNRTCINPEHLEIGSQADNKHDDWEHDARGIDADFL